MLKRWVLGVLFFLIGIGSGIYFQHSSSKIAAAPTKKNQTSLAALRLSPQTVELSHQLPGRTVAYQSAEVRPQVGGILISRLFEEGKTVTEGEQLYQIDSTPYRVSYEQAVANLEKEKANLLALQARSSRYQELIKVDAVSRQEYDDAISASLQANAAVSVAKAALEETAINLEYTKVYAPLSGIISKSSVTKGALLTPDQELQLATITQLDPIYVDITQSSVALMELQRVLPNFSNYPVQLFLENIPCPYQHKGALQFHEVIVEPTTGSVQSRALFPNPEGKLLPGLFVRVHLTTSQPNTLLVPQKAAQRQPDGSLQAWTIDSAGKARKTKFSAKQAIGSAWIVESGLNPGDIVITGGTMNLTVGTTVHPIFSEDHKSI